MPAQAKAFQELLSEYEARFGKGIGVPFEAFDFAEKDFLDEMAYSLKTGIPFDQNSPRWRWGREPYPDGVVI